MGPKFCMNCGESLAIRDVDGTDRLACTSCSFVFWGNYSIGVGALVVKDNKFLLVRRAQEPGKGYWTNPGGYIEQLEPIEQTIVREVLEETNVTARVLGVAALRDQPHTIHNVYVAFTMEYVEGDPQPDNLEVDGAGFFDMEEMESMNVAPFTKWLVDVALNGKSVCLYEDKTPIVPLNGSGLFRIMAQ